MTKTTTALFVGAAVILAAPAMAQSAVQAAQPRIVSLSQAVATAETELGARAFDAELDRSGGQLVYEVDLVKAGRPIEAHIDATTGRLIRHTTPTRLRIPFANQDAKAAQGAPRSLSETIELIERSTHGRVTEIGLERAGGRHYYDVELAGAADRDVRVDLMTGAITPVIDD
ncbi:PepSY domain-containing protein [Phenylobacterium kunshanense]|nr:PepSY domain-containing protein [Phenylobacterium kunshanense]